MKLNLSKDEQYAIVAIADLLRSRKLATEPGKMLVLDDCAVTVRHADLILALANKFTPTFNGDTKPFPEDEL